MTTNDTVYDLRLPGTWCEINGYINFNFGHCTRPKDGKISMHNSFHSCREGLCTNMRKIITSGASTFETDKMRMIFVWKVNNRDPKNNFGTSKAVLKAGIAEADAWMRRGLSVLNACEKHAGWYLTRAYKCKGIADQFRPSLGHRQGENERQPDLVPNKHVEWANAYYFLSSRRWMKSSYLTSLYVLLVRMCGDKKFEGVKNFKGLMEIINKNTASGFSHDNGYIKSTSPYWEATLKGYSEIFEKKKIDYYWDGNRIGSTSNNDGHEGIQRFCDGSTSYTEAYQAMMKVKKNLDAKKK